MYKFIIRKLSINGDITCKMFNIYIEYLERMEKRTFNG